MRVAVTGSHGLIGSALVDALAAAGHHVTRVVRGEAGAGEVAWDPPASRIDRAGLEGHDAVVHLAGAGLGERRWTEARKAELRASRVHATALLAEALASLDRPPAVLASASAVGYYGDRGDEVLTEASRPGTGFLAELVRDWEAATGLAKEAGIRVVTMRSGIVVSAAGGALAPMLRPFRLGVGGPLGSGRQWWSWISGDDEVAAILHLLARDDLAGPVNLTAPEPVTNRQFVRALGRALHRPAVIPVPAPVLGLVVGRDLAREMVLASQRATPDVLAGSGFTFRHPTVQEALTAALGAKISP